ncbi:MAG: phosphotransferase family protein [Actinobacteria bacterium]|nr:phosphotransferase family protein [Actinomycetota bacterium]
MAATETTGVDLDALRPYFARHVEGATDSPLSATLIAGGRSNLTYVIGDGTHDWVLRRPPLGHVLPTAHDMGREYRVLRGLAPTDVPVPRPLTFCDDVDVIGAPFYVMEKVNGVILRSPQETAALAPEDARRCSLELIDVLARIHRVDYQAVGLGDFGHPDGFLERQVRRWAEQWDRSQTRPLPSIDEIARRLRAALPASPPPTIVHGDYRLDNTMLDARDAGRIVAVLDWEMATLGDPLTDVGLFLLYWGQGDAQAIATGRNMPVAAGFLTSEEVIEHYAAVSGRAVDNLDFYVVLAAYKLAIIVEGIHARFLMGKTLGEGFDTMGGAVERLAEWALDTANASSMPALRGS